MSREEIDQLGFGEYNDTFNYALVLFNAKYPDPKSLNKKNTTKTGVAFQHDEDIFKDPINKEELRRQRRVSKVR